VPDAGIEITHTLHEDRSLPEGWLWLVLRAQPAPMLKLALRSLVSDDLIEDAAALEAFVQVVGRAWLEENFADLGRDLIRYRESTQSDAWTYRLTKIVDMDGVDTPLFVEHRPRKTGPIVDRAALYATRLLLARRWHVEHCDPPTCRYPGAPPICPARFDRESGATA
jgi:hypothetical protein